MSTMPVAEAWAMIEKTYTPIDGLRMQDITNLAVARQTLNLYFAAMMKNTLVETPPNPNVPTE